MTMSFKTVRRFALSLTFLLTTTPMAVPVFAQAERSFPPGTITLARDPGDPSMLLNQYLRQLSTSPRDLTALIGAGKAALAMGDANAGIGFFGRAEEVAPRDGRVKAGLAAAAVQQEQPKQALQLFDAAIAAGVPVSAIGGDRGLAYDLRGQNRLAQADYRAALALKPDDETVRRLALSTAIGGDRAGAMAILDPLLRRQDKAAWRAATFVQAMTGDPAGAVRRANQLMIPTQAAAMAPYLQRLGSLTAAEKAAAVHFGRFPAGARGAAQVATGAPVAAGRIVAPAGVSSTAALNRAAALRAAAGNVPPVAGGAPSTVLAMAQTSGPPAMPAATGSGVAVSGQASADAAPIGETAVPVVGAVTTAPTPLAPRQGVAATETGSSGALPADIVRMVTSVPTGTVTSVVPRATVPAPAPVVARSAFVATPVVTRPAVAKAVPVPVAPVVVEDGPVLSAAQKAKLGIRTKGAVAVASLTKAQQAVLDAADRGPVLTAAEKVKLGIPTRRVVTVASLTKAQQAKLDSTDADVGPVLTAAEKAKLGIRTKAAVTLASLTDAQKAKLDVAATDAAPVLTAAEKTKLGIKTKGAVTVASLTKVQKAKLDAVDTDAAPVLTAAEKTKLGIKTKGTVTVASLTKAQKAKLDAADTDVAPVLTAAEKVKLGIKTKGTVTVASLTKAQKAKLDAADTDAAPVLTAAEKVKLGIKTKGDVKVASLTKAQKAKLDAADKAPDKASAKASAKQPERYWVQVAGGANKATLPQAWQTVKGKYPALLAGRTPHTTALRATNRLLVGPFKSDGEAQAFVNKANGAGLNAFGYTSPAGVAVDTVPTK